jgi:hypothetical protein
MERCDMTLDAFVEEKLATVPPSIQGKVLNVCLLQLCHALAAGMRHFNFRHNNLHAGNVMITCVPHGTYTYKVAGKYYCVPNYGMCVKVINFKHASSDVFDEDDVVKAYAYSATIFHGLDLIRRQVRIANNAIDFYDMFRVLTALLPSVEPGETGEVFTRVFLKMRDISSRMKHRENSLKSAFSLMQQGDGSNVENVTQGFHDSALEHLFAFIAAEYVSSEAATDGTCFDMDKSPLNPSPVLSTVYERAFYLDGKGNLRKYQDVDGVAAAEDPIIIPRAAGPPCRPETFTLTRRFADDKKKGMSMSVDSRASDSEIEDSDEDEE